MSDLRVGATMTLAGITLIPIERISVLSEGRSGNIWLHASKDPVAIVIRDQDGTRALDVFAREISIDRLAAHVPDLRTVLESM